MGHTLSTQPLTGIGAPLISATLSIHSQLAIIGGGPAGLRAAEIAVRVGLRVTLYDAKPSVGRKFLVAGKGGLNLTHAEPRESFATRYSGPDQPAGIWENLIHEFDPTALREWAAELGVETFQASSGRVYPCAMKAAPLLRRWIERLRGLGLRFEMKHRLISLLPGEPYEIGFENGQTHHAEAVLLALGGGSWAKTGSDGVWTSIFETLGIAHHPLAPANCGWEHNWSPETLALAEGKPLKNLHVHAGDQMAIGELMLTRYGLEGGAIYQLGATLRAMAAPAITIDFKPTFSEAQLVAKLASVRRDFLNEARTRWKLSDPAFAILSRSPYNSALVLAQASKNFRIDLTRPRPLDEAISSAGGVCWREIDDSLMVKKFPGLFVAGEMIDWEAPTGGYLMQGCFATATHAAKAAVEWIHRRA